LDVKSLFQRMPPSHDPRGKPVKTTCYTNIDPLRPRNPTGASIEVLASIAPRERVALQALTEAGADAAAVVVVRRETEAAALAELAQLARQTL
jgi:hypothetical protein